MLLLQDREVDMPVGVNLNHPYYHFLESWVLRLTAARKEKTYEACADRNSAVL